MFGESIVSLLIVDGNNESMTYNVAFFSGVLSVIFLAHLHYSGEPHTADHHALSRSRHSNYIYIVLVPIYSLALIAMGVSYKLFLYEFLEDHEYDKSRRELGGDDGKYYNDEDSAQYSFTLKQQQRYAANLFSGSIVLVLTLLDVKQLLHRGLRAIQRQARHVPLGMLMLFVLLKYSMVVFLATLSIYQYDPNMMTFCGLGAIVFQEYLYNFFFRRRRDHVDHVEGKNPKKTDKDDDESTWISATSWSDYSGTSDEVSRKSGNNGGLALFERDSLMVDGILGTSNEEKDGKRTGSIKNILQQEDNHNEYSIEIRSGEGGIATLEYSRMAEI